MQLKEIGSNLWTYEGETVSFYGLPYSTRMTVIRINRNELWVHSPEKLNPQLQAELAQLGEVKYLISPNKLHHLYLPEWNTAYPEAASYAAPGLIEKRKDIQFTAELTDTPEPAWQDDIRQLIFKGSPAMQEVVFFHNDTRTLILTDLIENFDPRLQLVAKAPGPVHRHPSAQRQDADRLAQQFHLREKPGTAVLCGHGGLATGEHHPLPRCLYLRQRHGVSAPVVFLAAVDP